MGFTARGEHPDLDTWLDLVRGLLSTQEQQAALDHVATCRECEEQFRHTAASNARGQAVLSSIGGAAPPGRAAASAARVRRLPVWVWTAAAAAVVTGFVIGVPVLRRATERRVAVPTVTLPSAKLRGAIRGLLSTAADSTVVRGIEAYDGGDFTRARELLTPPTDGVMEPARRLYLGSVLLELSDAPGACRVLRTVAYDRIPEPWKSESRWTLARAFAVAGNAVASDSLLQVLASEDGEVAERARAALGRAVRGR